MKMQGSLKEKLDAMESKAIINSIIPFSNVDGPGNRFAIFFQGCNANCIYCHNPETIHYCRNCLQCMDACPVNALSAIDGRIVYNDFLCINCDACIQRCTNQASPKTKKFTVYELYEQIKSYKPFIQGVTVSGGEPTLNKIFITELFHKIKELGLTCFVDTNCFFNKMEMGALIDVTDKFMIDIKGVDEVQKLCNMDHQNYMENLIYLLKKNKVYEVRTVIVNDFMDAQKTVCEVSSILKTYPDVLYKLIRVHTNGLDKDQKEKLNEKIPNDEKMQQLKALAKAVGVNKVECIL